MRLLVTGGTGYLGGATVDAARARGHEVVSVARSVAPAPGRLALDLTDASSLERTLDEVSPDGVVHTAYVRSGPAAAAVIVGATAALAAACARRAIRLVHVSTDAVFGGASRHPIAEDAPPDPVSTYGLLKAQAEVEVLRASPDAAVVRTSLLYGGRDRPGVQEDLVGEAAVVGSDITFFTDEVRAPAHVDDVALGLVLLAERDDAGIFHLAGPDPVDRLTFARSLAAHLGLDGGVLRGAPTPTSFPRRPGHLVLACKRYDDVIGGPRRSIVELGSGGRGASPPSVP